jgi:hypothetical protein
MLLVFFWDLLYNMIPSVNYQMKVGGNIGRVEVFWVLFSLSWFSSAALLSPTGVNFEGTQTL